MTKRILIVDDALTVRLFCRHLLEAEGYEVSEAINGLEGLEVAMQKPFDLFCVDVNMQKMDGYGFLREARRNASLTRIPAMMMSTEAADQDVSNAWTSGANFYVFKPIRPDRFLSTVRVMTGGRA